MTALPCSSNWGRPARPIICRTSVGTDHNTQWGQSQSVEVVLGLSTCDGVVHVAPGLAIVVLGSLDDHQVSWEVDPPGQGAGGDEDLRESSLRDAPAPAAAPPGPAPSGTWILEWTNSSSTTFLSCWCRPAWCRPMPKASVSFRLESITVETTSSIWTGHNTHRCWDTPGSGGGAGPQQPGPYLPLVVVQPLSGVVLRGQVGHQVQGRQPRLSP